VIEEYERRKNPKDSDIRLFRGAIINKEERDIKDIRERKLRIKASKKVIDSDEDENETDDEEKKSLVKNKPNVLYIPENPEVKADHAINTADSNDKDKIVKETEQNQESKKEDFELT